MTILLVVIEAPTVRRGDAPWSLEGAFDIDVGFWCKADSLKYSPRASKYPTCHVYPSLCRSIYPSIHPSIYVSAYYARLLSIAISIYLSIYLFINAFIYMHSPTAPG